MRGSGSAGELLDMAPDDERRQREGEKVMLLTWVLWEGGVEHRSGDGDEHSGAMHCWVGRVMPVLLRRAPASVSTREELRESGQ